jgi:hypothetical protein
LGCGGFVVSEEASVAPIESAESLARDLTAFFRFFGFIGKKERIDASRLWLLHLSWHWFGHFGGAPARGEQSLFLQQFFGNRNNLVRFEAEFLLQFLKGRRSAESMHPNDSSPRANVTLPSER